MFVDWSIDERYIPRLSLLGRFAELVKEVCGKLVFTLFELFLSDSLAFENGDVQSVFLAFEHVRIKEVYDLA